MLHLAREPLRSRLIAPPYFQGTQTSSILKRCVSILLFLGFQAKANEASCKPMSTSSPKLTLSVLGKTGRFGNQIFQYLFAKMYEKKYGVPVEIPRWDGDLLFDLKDQKMTLPFCNFCSDEQLALDSYLGQSKPLSSV